MFIPACMLEHRPCKVRFAGQIQGTYYEITYFDQKGRSFQEEIDSLLKMIDYSVSLWDKNSVISRVNRNDTAVNLDEIFIELFRMSDDISEKTDGCFDITVGPLVNAWGFGFTGRKKVDKKVIDSLLPLVSHHNISVKDNKVIKSDPAIQIDFNAIAQGYSVDLIARFLETKGIMNYLIDIGGEVFARGEKPDGIDWVVGIESPAINKDDERSLIAKITVRNMAVATSGSYRKYFEEDGIRYSHTIDPKTGYPVRHSLLSVTVLASDCATADAYATAFMVMGMEKSMDFIEQNKDLLNAYFIYSDRNGNYNTYGTTGIREVISEWD